MTSTNIFGTKLEVCSTSPITGYFRNGCCDTEQGDFGKHTICAVMTGEFLEFSRQQGNDLSTPRPEWQFPGLKAGDRWCLCLSRWVEALEAGKAPLIIPESCHESVLEVVNMNTLLQFAHNRANSR